MYYYTSDARNNSIPLNITKHHSPNNIQYIPKIYTPYKYNQYILIIHQMIFFLRLFHITNLIIARVGIGRCIVGVIGSIDVVICVIGIIIMHVARTVTRWQRVTQWMVIWIRNIVVIVAHHDIAIGGLIIPRNRNGGN